MSMMSKEDLERFRETGSISPQDGCLLDAEALDAYDAMAREFIRKVDTGEARSIRTVAEMRRILERRRA